MIIITYKLSYFNTLSAFINIIFEQTFHIKYNVMVLTIQKRDCNRIGNSLFVLLSYLPYFITVAGYLISIHLQQHCNYFFLTLNSGRCKTQNLNSCICKQSVFSLVAGCLNFLSMLAAVYFHYQRNFLIEFVVN